MDFERNILEAALKRSGEVSNAKVTNELQCVSNLLSDEEAASGMTINKFNYSKPLSAETIAFYQTVKYM